MKINSVFTICAKNYLAQALTLKESAIKHNPEIDFYIYLADDADNLNIEGMVKLDKSWISDWVNMAYKYNVIEFNTSIKPFCFNHLFNKGYQKVVYLDPDIYVTDSLDMVFDSLNDKSVMLTPHFCDISKHFDGAVSEYTFNKVGICNLGFCAIKKDSIGKEIIEWWMNRLQFDCYSDPDKGLCVDQKWMDYIPSFFPEEALISHHHGLNVAIWNLHERELLQGEDGRYIIKRKKNGQEFPLIFFHFSGFDPFDNITINRRHPQFNVATYPSFKPIIDEYRAQIYANDYDKYASMSYGFNQYSDGSVITPLHRRLFRCCLEKNKVGYSPFDIVSPFYGILRKKKLLLKFSAMQNGFTSYIASDKQKGKNWEHRYIQPLLKVMLRILGVEKFAMMIRCFELIGKKEYYYYLINKDL